MFNIVSSDHASKTSRKIRHVHDCVAAVAVRLWWRGTVWTSGRAVATGAHIYLANLMLHLSSSALTLKATRAESRSTPGP